MTNMQWFASRCYGPGVASLNVRFPNLHMIPINPTPSIFTEEMRKEGRQLLPVILQAGFLLQGQTLAGPPVSHLPAAEGLEASTAGTAGPSCAGESHLDCTWLKSHPLVTLFLSKLLNSSRAETLHQSISILRGGNACLMADVFHEHLHKRVFSIYYEALLHENCVKMEVCKTELKMLSIYCRRILSAEVGYMGSLK